MIRGYLTSINIILQRKRIRDSLARVEPLNHLMRCQPIVRRVYRVPGANSLWHIDGNHKLIKWRFIIHGGIDGFSRLIDYLHCSTNNRSATVMTLFHEAAETYRVPSQVRSDMGGENILVGHYIMVLVRGIGRGSHLAGSSTRNQRIERLWRGVNRCVASTYHTLFHSMEATGVLDPKNEGRLIGSALLIPSMHQLFIGRICQGLE